jgi:hypothetical protein
MAWLKPQKSILMRIDRDRKLNEVTIVSFYFLSKKPEKKYSSLKKGQE